MALKTSSFQLNESGEFIVTDYNSKKLFSSFFPGVAGADGIPMWTFYVNRGQCICSMGIQDKDHAILEFLPANRAFQLVTTQGFRTFIKPSAGSLAFYEPFQNRYRDAQVERTQRMTIAPSKLTLEEVNQTLGLTFTVEYCNVPQDDYAGLIRTLRIRNNNSEPFSLEGLDGVSLLIPFGVDNNNLKFTRRLMEAFVEFVNLDQQAPLFRVKVEPADRPEVVRVKQGNFYLGFESDGTGNRLVKPIVDPARIFGSQNDLSYPERFLTLSAEEIINGQILENRLPCAMGIFNTTIEPGETYTYTSIIGHVASVEALNSMIPRLTDPTYVSDKGNQDKTLIKRLTQGNFICSRELKLDLYTRQNYLDNGLRGGFPITLAGEESRTAFYMYSRKHGDLERDYNHFSLSPTKYSQGNANYRDVNQNRRNDLFFNPDVRTDNVELFFNLIQLDGFNPLVIKEVYFSPNDTGKLQRLLNRFIGKENCEKVLDFLTDPFTPGLLLAWLQEQKIALQGPSDEFLGRLIETCDRNTATEHGEGFWTDHWTYNLDLLENYLAIYPEDAHPLLFENRTFTFYDNAYRVQAREEKFVIWDGTPMQLDAIVLDKNKNLLIKRRKRNQNTVRTVHGQGEIYMTTLAIKLLCLVTNKLASLDPEGVGIEMEADKPNWYDALNGLPGILGSSISETLELKRNILFLQSMLETADLKNDQVQVFEELGSFVEILDALLKDNLSPFDFWDRATTAKESYRAATRLGISGKETKIPVSTLLDFFTLGLNKIDKGIEKGWNREKGVLSTYFINEVSDYSEIKLEDGSPQKNAKGMPCYRANAFRQIHLPLFLEGPVHFLRTRPEPSQARQLAQNIKRSGLYDQKLKMYKVNASLSEQPMEIGRARVFSPGWFENESIWLHMEYKYLLELLRNELFDVFYQDFKNVFIPFFDPEIYGRSILENSSFIVSSANPDSSIHGNGFVARLSGATAEFMNIMLLMTAGPRPFSLSENGELQLEFRPALPEWLFTNGLTTRELERNGDWKTVVFPPESFSFMFLGETLVTYLNPGQNNTFGQNGARVLNWTLWDRQGIKHEVPGAIINGPLAEAVRDRLIERIVIELG